MKRTLFILIALALAAACDKPKQPSQEEKKASLSLFPTTVAFESTPSEATTVSLSSNTDWTASDVPEWATVTPKSGTGNASLTVSATRNTGAARSATVTFQDKAHTVSATLTLTQKAGGSESEGDPVVPAPAAFDGNKRASTTYQLLIYSFADSDGNGVGDFNGIKNKLDYLNDLGATALWLSPAQAASSYHGYDVTDYSKVNPAFGTEQEFKDLIDAAHAKGIKIYMDYVLNHSGIDNVWFKAAVADPSGPYRNFYVFSDNPDSDVNAGKIYNYGGKSSPGMGGWTSVTLGKVGYTGRLHFKLDWTGSTKTVTVTETTEAAQQANAAAKMWLWLGSAVGLYETATDIFEITYDVDTDWGFLVRSSTTTWDNGTKWGGNGKALTLGQPYALNNSTAANITFGGWQSNYFHSFPESMPDLDYGPAGKASESPAFQALAETADKWIKMGVDGFRLDAVAWIYNESIQPNQRFLQQWYDRCNATYKAQGHTDNMFMVGEAWTSHGNEAQYYKGLPSLFEFDYFSNNDNCTLRRALNGNAGGYVKDVSDFIKDHTDNRADAITSFFLTNHDQPRAAEILGKDAAKLKQAAAMLLTTPGKPFIYQGEELGYYGSNGGGDNYIRTPILWDKRGTDYAKKGVYDQIPSGLDNEKYSVEYQKDDGESLLNVYKTWSRLRNTYPALAEGTMTASSMNGGTVASWYMTSSGGEKLLVIHNTGGSPKTLTVSDDVSRPVALLGTATLSGKTLKLGARSSVVFQQ